MIDARNEHIYFWVYLSEKSVKYPIILYQHELPQKFLKEFTGYLHSDGYTAYGKLQVVKNSYCWAHVRRKFHEAIGSQPSKLTGEKYCNLLFKEERKLAHLDAKARQEQRTLWIKPIVEEFFSLATDFCVLPNLKIGKAIEYSLKYKEGLCTFLEEGRLELSNNRAERAIKELVIGRQSWLFSKSEPGVKSSGIILSIIRTALENGLDPRKYLIHLFEKIP